MFVAIVVVVWVLDIVAVVGVAVSLRFRGFSVFFFCLFFLLVVVYLFILNLIKPHP